MNDLLTLTKEFQNRKKENHFNILSSVYEKKTIKSTTIKEFIYQLDQTLFFWQHNNYIEEELLISAYEKTVIAKTHRIHRIFKYNNLDSNSKIVGASFYNREKGSKAHVFTYLISKKQLRESISLLESYLVIFQNTFGDAASQHDLDEKARNKIPNEAKISLSDFYQITHELSYVDKFDILECHKDMADSEIMVTFYQTNSDIRQVLKKLSIDYIDSSSFDKNTVLLDKVNYDRLMQLAPYLISMSVKNFTDSIDESLNRDNDQFEEPVLPKPGKEPTIGVIDTLFDGSVYFKDFVQYQYLVDSNIPVDKEDANHGTGIDSLIVDLPHLNPSLDDGCGYFKVRHFGIATKGKNSLFTILEKIQAIVYKNRDIHVWNLSLGSSMEISENSISPVAALLDQLESKFNMIFVVAGTNKQAGNKKEMYIGSPADSINSVVVNSVDENRNPVSYSRRGPVLGFFIKPDIGYYGGDDNHPLNVYYDRSIHSSWGTSYAAPLIARKLCYLIDVLGISRENAKALLINSAIPFDDKTNNNVNYVGYGVVPIKIKDIVSSEDDEIKFIIRGKSKKYYTYDYSLPVPSNEGVFPYSVKATLCYFPTCNRNQGVDYTGTELEFKIGKINNDKIVLNSDKGYSISKYMIEDDSRKIFRKWDNIKVLKTKYSVRSNMKADSNGIWGIQIAYYDRNLQRYNGKLPEIAWGLAITLKATDHKNRIDSFINQCTLKQWLVNKITIQNRVKIYNQMKEDIHFE